MDKKFYFIGIGGISMSALAIFLKFQGHSVSGSDITYNENLRELEKFDIPFKIGHNVKNIEEFNPDIVVINCAIKTENDELKWAKRNKIKIITRAKLLGDFAKSFKNVIAIAGSHGKTTTVAMISEIFINAGLKPTVHIGGMLNKTHSNFALGDNKFFITEACEYQNSFLCLKPKIGVSLNVEADHLDFFKDIEDIKLSFNKFLNNSKIQIEKSESQEFTYVFKQKSKKIIFSAKNIRTTKLGVVFQYYENDKFISTYRLNTLGLHNINDAIVAIKIALFYKVKNSIIKNTLKNYEGVERRFQKLGYNGKTIVIHDYAHHPTEIKKVISQAKNYGKILTVFQPHTYSRTKELFEEFKEAFNESNKTIFYKTYPARESESAGYSAEKLYDETKDKLDAEYFSSEENLIDYANRISQNYDVILVLGAGDINLIAKKLVK